MSTPNANEKRGSRRWPVWKVVLIAVLGVPLVGVVVILVAVMVVLSQIGDPARAGNLRVENRTERPIVVTDDVVMGGSPDRPTTHRVRLAVVPPHVTAVTGGRCDLVQVEARYRGGAVIDTHRPTGTCDEIVSWIVGDLLPP
jgi:hypothetical protein